MPVVKILRDQSTLFVQPRSFRIGSSSIVPLDHVTRPDLKPLGTAACPESYSFPILHVGPPFSNPFASLVLLQVKHIFLSF